MDETHTSITILLPAGRLPVKVMKCVTELTDTFGLSTYLTTAQNLRLNNIPEASAGQIRKILNDCGVDLKAPGKFPIPRVCMGTPHCQLSNTNTEELSDAILQKFSKRTHTKAKLKIAVSGCQLCCSGVKTTDIGVIAGKNGYEVHAGGKGGHSPRVGRCIKKDIDLPEVLETIEALIEFHDSRTKKKQRLYKLLSDPDFPFKKL